MAKYLTIIGPIASGKGTQASVISRKYGLAHLSPGAIFRDAIASGTEVGLKVRNIVESGYLVPDSMVNDVVRDVFGTHDFARGFILDGYPRTLNQAVALDGMLSRLRARLDAVIRLDMDDEEVVGRISGRYYCV
ncbi:MAG: nucleoside monophosphate kinase, partial [Rickettsiales bacterium]|nr:nucleoside monophosphate kinase [Rickettsiales bacterium]